METKWLEDFVSLAETHSFSRSAQLRHVTQPAFSRRIQSLEAWAGADLVDRSAYPTRLTPAGETLYAQALEMLQSLQHTRAMLRGHATAGADVIEFAVPHTLALTFFPAWVSGLRENFGTFKSRLIALNVHDAVLRLTEGSCDLLLAYHHASHPFQLDAERYEMVSLGKERIAPYARPDARGQPQFLLPGSGEHALPYLAYAPDAYLGQVVDFMLKQVGAPIHLDRVYETDMAEGLKAMALEGHGLAFLPHSAVRNELHSGRLVSAVPPALAGLQLDMDVRLYREKPAVRDVRKADTKTGGASRGACRVPKPLAQALWTYLQAPPGKAA
jgi:DNA-binding transcriptional LysR family regulator